MPLGRLNDGLGRPNKNTLFDYLVVEHTSNASHSPHTTQHTKIARSHQRARHNEDRRSLKSPPSNTTTMSLSSNSWLRGQTHVRAQTRHVACRVGVHLRRRPPATPLAVAFQTDAYRTDDASPACITPLRRLANDPFAVVSPERGFLPSRDPLQRCDRSLVCCCVCVGYD